jgi:hypothetical protein
VIFSYFLKTFENWIQFLKIFQGRQRRKLLLDSTGGLPDFSQKSAHLQGNWKVRPVPRRLQCRHLDLGDVSPSNTSHFVASLKTTAQGIQVCWYFLSSEIFECLWIKFQCEVVLSLNVNKPTIYYFVNSNWHMHSPQI